LLILTVLTSQGLFAQDDFVERFSAIQSGSVVHLNWSIAQGNLCNGQGIQRSSDGLYFSTIGFLDGVCGSLSESVKYTFTDSLPPANSTVYYRIDLGPYGFSESASVLFIDAGQRPFHIYTDNGLVHFRSLDQNLEYNLSLVASDGTGIMRYTGRGWADVPVETRFAVVRYRIDLNGQTFTGGLVVNR